MKILVLNSGSSSQKTSLYDLAPPLPANPPQPLWEGKLDWRDGRASLEARNSHGATEAKDVAAAAPADAAAQLLDFLTMGQTGVVQNKSEISAVGHRIVNGGPDYTQPALITPGVRSAIEKMAVFAPLHNKAGLEGIALIEKIFGSSVAQIAVFDTGFHSRLPQAAAVYPGPYEWFEQGIRRYGFHGINHRYVSERAAQLMGRDLAALKLVTCHLGNGCSLAAVREGRSIDTTMGFTPLEGLMMGTRSGSVDPAILTYLMREQHLSAGQIDDLLNKQSGLLGISGLSSDMRRIVSAMEQGNARAKLAFDIFVHRLQTGIGSMAAALAGLDALVFTAGIGENSSEVRAAACSHLAFLGLALDPHKNASPQGDADISDRASPARVFVIHAEEDWSIARQCLQLLQPNAA
ncbi:MAG TPA: acetate kinase [Candidatus Aquilonibacter sp.]|nr:acetate kinase [Candidatus Aquilonibacter sp.]